MASGEVQVGNKENFLLRRSGEALERAAHGSGGSLWKLPINV